jgi:hypothetical protein
MVLTTTATNPLSQIKVSFAFDGWHPATEKGVETWQGEYRRRSA